MTKQNLTIILLALCNMAAAQKVVSLAKDPAIQDGLYVDPQGNVYTTCGGLVQKTTIGMYDPKSESFKVINNEMQGSIDIASLNGSVLYATNYDDNTVKRFDQATGETSDFASDLNGPAGIEIDKLGNLYITSFGAPPEYSGNSIYKVSSDGVKELLIQSDKLFQPQGLAWYDDHTLVVSNSSRGEIFLFDINTKELSLFTETGESHGNIAVGRGKIYMASTRGHKILELNYQGEVTRTLGSELKITGNTLPEVKDGPIATANFLTPQGLAFSPDEKRLYVSQIGNGALRCIIFDN